MAVQTISDDNYDDVTKTGLVLVDFWAEWCGPCKVLSPIIDELSSEVSEVSFAKMNVDDNQLIPQKLGITAIPTLILYKGGSIVDRVARLMPKPQLLSFLQKHIV